MGVEPSDYDVASDARPEQVGALFGGAHRVGESFGVMLVSVMGHQIEVATFRSDGFYSDGRRPDTVTFSDASHDARRRDFTINGLFEDPLSGRVIDFVGGQADLEARLIKAIGDPEARLAEDQLRMLRAVRFAARFSFAIDTATAEAIRGGAEDLGRISRERIGQEVRRMLTDRNRAVAAREIQYLGLDAAVLGESHQTAAPTRLGRLMEQVAYPTALAAWMLDRAEQTFLDVAARVRGWSTALVLALDDEKRQAFSNYDHHIIKNRPCLEPSPLPLFPSPDGQRPEPFPPWYWERVEKMAEFTMHSTKPTGHIHQVGDNDSGRFLNLQPVFRRLTPSQAESRFANLAESSYPFDQRAYWDENSLDHRSLVAACNGFFQRDDFRKFCGSISLETKLIGRLIGGRIQPAYSKQQNNPTNQAVCKSSLQDVLDRIGLHSPLEKQCFRIELPCAELLENMSCHAYEDFGLYIWRSERFYLAVRCGPVGQNGLGGHAHNDQLAIELSVENRDWI
ncbi:MAG: heparinase II/III family protein, partial [Planctomycetes bacterium]|nr:heparinase II/III family protein [Planctomycetota bacterium]